MKNQKSKPKQISSRKRLRELYSLSNRIKFAILGEQDIEYRTELDELNEKVSKEIETCRDAIENNRP